MSENKNIEKEQQKTKEQKKKKRLSKGARKHIRRLKQAARQESKI